MLHFDNIKSSLENLEVIGVSKLDPAKYPGLDPKAIRLSNFCAIVGAVVSFSQFLIEIFEKTYFYAISDLFAGLLLLVTLLLNKFGFFKLSRVYVLLILNLDVLYFNMLSSFSARVELLFLTFALFPFFLFGLNQLLLLVVTSLIPFVFYCLNTFFTEINFVPSQYRFAPPDWYEATVPVMAFGVSFAIIYRFLKVNQEMQIKIMRSAKFSSLGEMASGISHEINNPLTAIILNANLAKRQLLESEQAESLVKKLESIEGAGARAAKVIHGLKQFSRSSYDEPYGVFEVKECIEETLALCRERFVLANVHLDLNLKPGLMVYGNKTLLSQVILNLLNNAFDAVKASSEKWVRIEQAQIKNKIEIRLIDSGPGIPKKLQSKIMDPFFTTKPVGEGTGLGLSISKGIVEAHQGELVLDLVARNTTFKIHLPLQSNLELSNF